MELSVHLLSNFKCAIAASNLSPTPTDAASNSEDDAREREHFFGCPLSLLRIFKGGLFPSLISCGPVDPFSQVSLSLRSCRSSCPNINQLWQWKQLSHSLTGPMSHQPLACPDWHNKGFTVIFTHHSFTNNTVRHSVNRNASSPTSPLEIRAHSQR